LIFTQVCKGEWIDLHEIAFNYELAEKAVIELGLTAGMGRDGSQSCQLPASAGGKYDDLMHRYRLTGALFTSTRTTATTDKPTDVVDLCVRKARRDTRNESPHKVNT
jgi:hypothetical protein